MGLVSCARSKASQSAPARELYVSVLFRKAARYSERNYDRWYILSAKHGLVEPNKMLEPYNESLKGKSRPKQQDWADKVFQQLLFVLPKPRDCLLYFHAGVEYRKLLLQLLVEKGYDCKVPLQGLAIGEQLAWYKARQ